MNMLKLPLPDLNPNNHYRHSSWTRVVNDCVLNLSNTIILKFPVHSYDGGSWNSDNTVYTRGKYINTEDYHIEAPTVKKLIARSPNPPFTKVYKYEYDPTHVIKYVSKGQVLPHLDNGDETFTPQQWLSDNENKPYINPDYANAIAEADVFINLFQMEMLGELRTWFVNTFNEVNTLGRFDFEEGTPYIIEELKN